MRHSAPAKQPHQQRSSRDALVPLEFKTGKRHQSHRAQAGPSRALHFLDLSMKQGGDPAAEGKVLHVRATGGQFDRECTMFFHRWP